MDKFEPKKIKEASKFLDKILQKQASRQKIESLWVRVYKKFIKK